MTDTPTIHGPYEDAIIAICELMGKIVEGQPPAVKAELWDRYLTLTKPLHDLAVAVAGKVFK